MATHSSVLAWRIPGTGHPAGLPSMGSHRVGHDWGNLAAWEYSEQNLDNLKLCKTNSLVYSTTELQEKDRRGT